MSNQRLKSRRYMPSGAATEYPGATASAFISERCDILDPTLEHTHDAAAGPRPLLRRCAAEAEPAPFRRAPSPTPVSGEMRGSPPPRGH